MTDRFLGRSLEIKQLEEFFAARHSSFLVIKGRRRIGKSRLIDEFVKSKKCYKFAGIAPEEGVTAQTQRNDFARRLKNYFSKLPNLKADDWAELFDLLGTQTQKGKVVIVFDEISWMAAGDPSFLGKLKNAWDELYKQNPKLMLIICGSVSSWIDKNLLSSTSFVGRVHFVMQVKELPIEDCVKFWAEQQNKVSAQDKLKFLSVSGGIPLYLENLEPKKTVEDNIERLCFRSGGLLYREFNNIFNDLFDKRSSTYKNLVETLVNGPLDMESIAKHLGKVSSGVLSDYLNDLVEAGFITRDYSWAFSTGKRGKLSRYRLSDNYVRFYLKYVAQNADQIENGRFANKSLQTLPAWSSTMGLQLENLVLNNRQRLWETLEIKASDIVNDGAFFQTQTNTRKGCQIDYLIQTQYNNLFVCEVKHSRNEIKKGIIQEMEDKLKALKAPRHFSVFPVLITDTDVSDAVLDENYFVKVIDLRRYCE